MKKFIIPLLALVAVALPGGDSQVLKSGMCPDVTVKQKFNIEKYMGTWYQYASFGTEAFQGKGKCVKAQYYLNGITGLVDVLNSQQPLTKMKSRLNRAYIKGTLMFMNPRKEEGKFLVTLSVPVVGTVTAPLWVLDTDYKTWSVAYTCLDFWFFHVTSSWILTRDRVPSFTVENVVKPIIEQIELTIDNYKKTDQDGCEEQTLLDTALQVQHV